MRVKRYDATPTGSSTLAWLLAIAANCCFDWMKRHRREEVADNRTLARLDRRAEGSPSDSDRRAVLGTVLRQLDKRTRQVGVLHYLDGFTQEEVADRTGYSRKTIGKKLRAFEEELKRRWMQAGGLS